MGSCWSFHHGLFFLGPFSCLFYCSQREPKSKNARHNLQPQSVTPKPWSTNHQYHIQSHPAQTIAANRPDLFQLIPVIHGWVGRRAPQAEQCFESSNPQLMCIICPEQGWNLMWNPGNFLEYPPVVNSLPWNITILSFKGPCILSISIIT